MENLVSDPTDVWNFDAPSTADTAFDEDHLSTSLAERRTRRPRVLPQRFRDDIPQPLAQFPPPLADLSNLPAETHPAREQSLIDITTQASPGDRPSARSRITQCFRTPRNTFRLLRQYFSSSPPSHDPEELVDFSGLCNDHGNLFNDVHSPLCSIAVTVDTIASIPKLKASESFGPYPNESSFLLGDWYWNGGRQKSLEDFRSLLDIIGRPYFRPEDVHGTKWHAINGQLGKNEYDDVDAIDEAEVWLDDAGWRKSPISISVPFHKRAQTPGAKDFFVGYFHHRSITAVIKEKLSNPDDTRYFHYEPFELLWQQYPAGPDVRVHGELYNSPAFLDVHRDLQAFPNEPDCDLQKVVIALMFLSDTTHLTQFRTAKLWPGYLMFGNDSKYWRCKPTCNLCHHITYFQAVSL